MITVINGNSAVEMVNDKLKLHQKVDVNNGLLFICCYCCEGISASEPSSLACFPCKICLVS